MNRIKISPLATSTLDRERVDPNSPSYQHQLKKLAARSLEPCSVFVPMHYERNYSYPLVIWLHSDGDDSSQLQRIMPSMSVRNYIGISPQAPFGDRHQGYHWQQAPGAINQSEESVLEAIDFAAMRYNVNSKRIFLAGCGAGGTMAFRVAFQRPEIFAGVLSVNGPLPVDQCPLADWNHCRDVPVYWSHFRKSMDFEQDSLCEQLRLLHIAGFSVTLRQYPGEDGQLSTSTLSDMNDWIMESIDSAVI